MKNVIGIIGIAIALMACQSNEPKTEQLSQWVNPFIGTGGHGHTYPGATVPFGMVQLSPDTRLDGWDGCSGYHYTDSVIFGFSHTHLSGTGVSDYGDVLLMPIQGEINFDNGSTTSIADGYASNFQKKHEKAEAGYYQVKLDQYDIDARLTTTKRVGIHEYTFNSRGESHLILDLEHRDRLLEDSIAVLNSKEIVGKRISKAWATEQHLYFVIQFSKEFVGTKRDSSGHKIAINFDMQAQEKLMIKVGISAVSIEGARKNLEEEAKHWDFESYLKDAKTQWEKALTKITIEEKDANKKTIFYTALYHSMLAPNTFSDVDGRYRGMDQKVHQADHTVYTVFSLWDTFRATHPLFTIIEQDKTNEFINTFLTQYQDGGELPIWELAANYTGCMIGYHAIPVIADAYLKGIQEYDHSIAMKAMLHSAELDKLGLEAYKRKGYIAVGDESESVSKTLEYAYDDWCIAKMANKLGDQENFRKYISRGQNFKNIFNPEVGFMQSKMNGGWTNGFDPAEVNFNFTEANSWQYSMFAPQDISGMIDLYGGSDKFEKKLDLLFTTKMELSGRHQVDITGLIGQYAHGNEPSHHMAYLYNYIGKAYKTQARVKQILNEQYSNAPDGLSGNEDCGQMSSWYVLSSMGFYSVTPALDYYAIGTPHFEKVSLQLESGQSFSIEAKGLSEQNIYIQSATLNGVDYDQSYLFHEDIMKGGKLVFVMGDQPNKSWAANNAPSAKIEEEDQIVAVPYFNTSSQTFTDSLSIEIKSVNSNATIFYQLNEGEFQEYQGSFVIKENAKINAYAMVGERKSLEVKEVNYKKIKGGRSIELLSEYSNQYSAGGDKGLIDYLEGGTNFRTGYWQGYWETDFSAIVDLGEIEEIAKVSVGALQDIKSWIWYPKKVVLSISIDGKEFTPLAQLKNDFSDQEYGGFRKDFEHVLKQRKKVRFLKVEAESYGTCPDWHLGAGNPTWLFLDEITIE